MATQFSSLDVVDDIVSEMPEHIIHCILGFLSCTKDVVRTSAISKSWFQAWRTFPVLKFNLEDFVSLGQLCQPDEEKTKQFIGFVYNTLQRFGRQNGDRMKIFKLRTLDTMAHHTNRWIGMALDNKIEHLDLFIITGADYPQLLTSIPDRVFSADWLKSLILVGQTIDFFLTKSSRVDLPSLTSLRIKYSNIVDEGLQQLLRGCPFLEHIALLDCELLSEIDISENPNLETLQVTVGNINADHLTAISVRAPKLISFLYACKYERDVVVEIHNSPRLKILGFSYGDKTDEWFHKFVDQFPLIENLVIYRGYNLRKIRISNPHLEKINIANCRNLEDVVISSKKLECLFLSTLQSSIPKPFIRIEMDNPPNRSKAEIKAPYFTCDHLMKASWYCKLNEFLTTQFTFKSVNISVQTCLVGYESMVWKDLPAAACNIEKLSLGILAPSYCHYAILNGLFSACHPTTLKLDVESSDNDFIKLVCYELWNREHNNECCCKYGFKCWKLQLKDVKIEKIKGIKLEENLDWDVLSNMLPTVEVGNNIYFKLRW